MVFYGTKCLNDLINQNLLKKNNNKMETSKYSIILSMSVFSEKYNLFEEVLGKKKTK